MIIVLITDTFNMHNNGITISAMRFAEGLTKIGNRVRVVCCGDPPQSGTDPKSGYQMYYVPEMYVPVASYFAHKQDTLFAKPVRSTLLKAMDGADVVHIYEPFALGREAQRIAKKMGIPTIAGFHIQPENITYNIGLGWCHAASRLIYRLMYLFFYRRFNHIHCPSKFIASQLQSHGYKASLHIISNGVHPDFHPGEEGEQKGNTFNILMVGRLSPEKRQDVIIKAVMESKYADRIQIYFAGYGPWEKKLRRLGAPLPHPPIFGYYTQDELIKLIRRCHLYVHASDVEIEGISCMEAFCCGLVPIISDSRYSAAGQFALSGNNLFKAGDPSSLAERIDYWLSDPERLRSAGREYALFGQEYSLKKSIMRIEHVYESLSSSSRNEYYHSRLFNLFSDFFYRFIAAPILCFWFRVVVGVRFVGIKNLRSVKGAVTVCNHVHMLDSTLVAIACYPRKVIFTTLRKNMESVFPGILVRLFGCVAVPESIKELEAFFDQMEISLDEGHIVHFYPEGELIPYDTDLRTFKKGAFYLAARARVPIIPMAISFRKVEGIRRLYRKKPTMTLHIGKPIYPTAIDFRRDSKNRMNVVREQMNAFISESVANE